MAVLLSNPNLTYTKATTKSQAIDRNSSKPVVDSVPVEQLQQQQQQQQQQQSSPVEFSSAFPLPPKRVRRNPILLKINTSPLITQIQIPPRNPADCPPLSVKKSKKLKKSVSFALPLENKVITAAMKEEDGIILGDRNLSITPTSLTPTSSDSASSLSSSSSSSSNDELYSPCSPITYDDEDDSSASPSQENNGGYIELIRNPIKSRIWYEDEFFGDEEHLREQQELLKNTLQNMYVNLEPWLSKTNFT